MVERAIVVRDATLKPVSVPLEIPSDENHLVHGYWAYILLLLVACNCKRIANEDSKYASWKQGTHKARHTHGRRQQSRIKWSENQVIS